MSSLGQFLYWALIVVAVLVGLIVFLLLISLFTYAITIAIRTAIQASDKRDNIDRSARPKG